ncbi:putative NUDIX hydrolase [Bradyrhizobium sp. STM 3843]|uniref:NUDIX hydrolase n=1 Tax=Bradyrhizobium sp. STM 3843 TaxID=551947 RepID=UPI0002404916|nr:NUDIX hydrolase [Bradyrhizobium sp. STM 3843]CCE08024.1 putative NUDIX hydrolase [Bradyrhizobium sp. STM 3843]
MARAPVMAAGGIVLRREQPPRIAVVRLRKRDEWVLPKGKLDDGETPREAAKREVLEETGHSVTVHEFLGTLVYDTGVRAKVVHYWRMEASGEPTRALMNDVRAVDWLTLDAAVARLSREHEKTFLENVGPYALAGLIRKTKAKPAPAGKPAVAAEKLAKPASESKLTAASKAAATRKRRSRGVEEPPAPLPDVAAEPAELASSRDASAPMEPVADEIDAIEIVAVAVEPVSESFVEAAASGPADAEAEPEQPKTAPAMLDDVDRVQAVAAQIKSMIPAAKSSSVPPTAGSDHETVEEGSGSDAGRPGSVTGDDPDGSDDPSDPDGSPRRSLAQKMRAWLGRAA